MNKGLRPDIQTCKSMESQEERQKIVSGFRFQVPGFGMRTISLYAVNENNDFGCSDFESLIVKRG